VDCSNPRADHELIRLGSAVLTKRGVVRGSEQKRSRIGGFPTRLTNLAQHPHPWSVQGRTYSEHVEAAREIPGRTYVEDLRRISPAARATLARELEAENLGL
jgi:hypothetical protein